MDSKLKNTQIQNDIHTEKCRIRKPERYRIDTSPTFSSTFLLFPHPPIPSTMSSDIEMSDVKPPLPLLSKKDSPTSTPSPTAGRAPSSTSTRSRKSSASVVSITRPHGPPQDDDDSPPLPTTPTGDDHHPIELTDSEEMSGPLTLPQLLDELRLLKAQRSSNRSHRQSLLSPVRATSGSLPRFMVAVTDAYNSRATGS